MFDPSAMDENSEHIIENQYSLGDNETEDISSAKTGELLQPIKKLFPLREILFHPVGDVNQPTIVLEDWSDQSYYDHHGYYIEDKAGTGIYKLIENHPPCLKINGRFYSVGENIFKLNDESIRQLSVAEVTFKDCFNGQIKFSDLELENVGPKVIRYQWKRKRSYENTSLPIKLSPNLEQKFYFDSRPSLLVPGEKRKLGIGLKSKFTGIYKEDWKFTTFPRVHNDDIIFRFRALSSEKVAAEPWNRFDYKLNELHGIECATSILNYILRKVFESAKKLIGPEVLDCNKEEIAFLHSNSHRLSYKENVVNDLKELYETIFEERWSLNMFDFEEHLKSTNIIITQDQIDKFIKYKIELVKSDENLLPRHHYKKYNDVFQILGDTINDVQAIIDKARPKYSLKPLGFPANTDQPPYYYFPVSRSLTDVVDDSQKKLGKGKSPDIDKAGEKTKASDNKKNKKDEGKSKIKQWIDLVPKEPFKILPKEWSPENESYGEEVYESVYNSWCAFIEKLVNVLEDFQPESTSRPSLKKVSSNFSHPFQN